MTPRQQRRFEQKSARKPAKRALRDESVTPSPNQPIQSQERSDSCATSISEAKLAANLANAQLSTGPVTAEGRAIVSQNATRHGLTGTFKVLASESQSEFDRVLAGLSKSEAPVTDDEIEMVQQMAEALWLSRRSIRLQNDCFAALESGTPEEQRAAHKSLALYIRYQMTHDRTFTRYATELRKRRNERARTERGFVSQKHKQAADRRREELHAARQALQNVKMEAQLIRNRLSAAKAEALEVKNLAKKSNPPAEISETRLRAAA